MLCAAIVIRAIATCDFASMRHRPHRIVQPRLTTIMTYRPARGCPPNRAHSCLKSGRFCKARSIRRVVVVRPLVLARCLHANGRHHAVEALLPSPLFEHDLFGRSGCTHPSAPAACCRTGTWNVDPRHRHTLYTSSLGATFWSHVICPRGAQGRCESGMAGQGWRVGDRGSLGGVSRRRAFCDPVQNRFVRRASNLPLAARRRLGHIGLHGDVAEWLKAAVC
jgi:hypothetical protein